MTVKDLMKVLSELPQGAEVKVVGEGSSELVEVFFGGEVVELIGEGVG